MRSMQARLSFGLTASVVVLVAVLLFAAQYLLRQLAESFVATRVEQDMEALLAHLSIVDGGSVAINENAVNPIFSQPYSGHYYQVRSNDQLLRSRSLWDTELPMPEVGADLRRYLLAGPEEQQLLVLSRSLRLDSQTIELMLTEDIADLIVGIRSLLLRLALAAALILLALLLIQNLIVRRSLKPLRTSRADVQRLARGEIERLGTDAGAPSEVQPFIDEINRLAEITQLRLQRSRRAMGNLAHALKTPLARLAQISEQAGARLPSDVSRELARLTEQIRSLTERELRRARIVGSATPGRRVMMASEIDDLLLTLQKIHRDKNVALKRRVAPQSWFPGDRDDLLELLGNLLDNAYKWSTSTVGLTIEQTSESLRIVVEDDGPGCSDQQIRLLARRGVRIDEGAVGGHGLGLAIVTDIVEQYGGQIRLSRSVRLNGLCIEVCLPLPGTRCAQALSVSANQG